MNPVFCVADLIEHTTEAARAAAVLARRLQEDLVLVHSVDERGQFSAGLRQRLQREDRPRLAAETQRLRQLGLELDAALLGGMPDDGIGQFAGRWRARLVVVGGGPTGACERWVLGCAAEELAETSPVPTLVVRTAAPFEAWAHEDRPLRILLALDCSAHSVAALRWLRGLSRFGPCEILAGCIAAPLPAAGGRERGKAWSRGNLPSAPASEVERLLRARIAQEVGDESVRVGVATSHGPVEDDLVALANSSGAELLVVGTPQRHGLARLGHHSVSRAVIRQAPMNILCVPATGGAWPETAGTVENGAEPLLKREAALTRAGVREAGPGASAGSAALGAT